MEERSEQEGRPASPLSILVVDDEANIRRTLAVCLEADGHRVTTVGQARDALDQVRGSYFDAALVDLRLGVGSGLDLIPQLLSQLPGLKIVVITAYASIETAVEAVRRGAHDYIQKPFTPDQIRLSMRKLAQVRSLEDRLETLEALAAHEHEGVLFESRSPLARRLYDVAREAARSEATLLLLGESGTGKSALARAIHGWSPRAQRPFGAVSCPTLSPELLESELFGHVRGAFTGAVKDQPGRLAACEGGTLFLDEVGELPAALQAKLLRFLQDREYERLGDPATRKADVRLIAATNGDLEAAVKEGRFREDLFYRLSVIPLTLPPLRERPEDIIPCARRFLALFARRNHKPLLEFAPDAEEALGRHPWPGNLRELRNAVERAVILCRSQAVGPELLPGAQAATPPPTPGSRVTLKSLEEEHIRRILAGAKSLQEAAEVLGIDPATLYRKRKQLGI